MTFALTHRILSDARGRFRIGLHYTADRVGGSNDRGVDIRMRSSDDVPAIAQCKSRRAGGPDIPFVSGCV